MEIVEKANREKLWNSCGFYKKKTHIEAALWFFDISQHDVELGLAHIKALAKKRYREAAKDHHPDSPLSYKPRTNGYTFRRIKRWYDLIMGLDTVPLTLDNMNTWFELNKGYKTTSDYGQHL